MGFGACAGSGALAACTLLVGCGGETLSGPAVGADGSGEGSVISGGGEEDASVSDVAMGAEATPLEDADGGAVDDGALDDAVAADAAATLPNLHCDGGTPIVVCLQVYILEAKCFDDPNILALACDESVLDTGNNVAYATQTCEINLERLERSCE